MFEICNNATSDFISARRQIDELIKQGNKDSKQTIDVLGNKVEIYKVLHIFDTDQIPNDWANNLCNFYAKYLVNTSLPATLFNRKLCTLNYETSDPEGNYFKRFALTFPQSGKVPFNDYLLKLFECCDLVVRNIPHIQTIPHVISDDLTPAKYYIDIDWKKKLVPGQYALKDSKILNTFLHQYTNEEKLAIMGWAYTVLHPSYGDTINMLFKTGGGSFKTNYYSSMIQRLLCTMYNVKNNDCSYTMLKDTWVKDRFLLEGVNGGVSMAAFVNNDECTMDSIEEFKNFSPTFEDDIYEAIDLVTCVEERKVFGGPSSSSVKTQLELLLESINKTKEAVKCYQKNGDRVSFLLSLPLTANLFSATILQARLPQIKSA